MKILLLGFPISGIFETLCFQVIGFLDPLYLVLTDLPSLVVNKLYVVFFIVQLALEGAFDALSCLGF